jgi:endonuclease YncB( thermonuclease family)
VEELVKVKWIFAVLLLLLPSMGVIAEEAKKAERLDGYSFKQTAYHDGDSFSLLTAKGDEKICRLYAVDTCETDNEFAERVAEQALYFGITSEQAVELGNEAKNFTEERLKNKKLSFVTKWHKALGRSKSDRFYGEVIVDGESLACILVKNGLARIHGIIPPNDRTFVFTRAKLEQMEAGAKKAGLGGWGMAKVKARVDGI